MVILRYTTSLLAFLLTLCAIILQRLELNDPFGKLISFFIIIILLFLPGYAVITILNKNLKFLQKITFSFGLSISIIVLSAYVLDLMRNIKNISIIIPFLTLILCLIANSKNQNYNKISYHEILNTIIIFLILIFLSLIHYLRWIQPLGWDIYYHIWIVDEIMRQNGFPQSDPFLNQKVLITYKFTPSFFYLLYSCFLISGIVESQTIFHTFYKYKLFEIIQSWFIFSAVLTFSYTFLYENYKKGFLSTLFLYILSPLSLYFYPVVFGLQPFEFSKGLYLLFAISYYSLIRTPSRSDLIITILLFYATISFHPVEAVSAILLLIILLPLFIKKNTSFMKNKYILIFLFLTSFITIYFIYNIYQDPSPYSILNYFYRMYVFEHSYSGTSFWKIYGSIMNNIILHLISFIPLIILGFIKLLKENLIKTLFILCLYFVNIFGIFQYPLKLYFFPYRFYHFILLIQPVLIYNAFEYTIQLWHHKKLSPLNRIILKFQIMNKVFKSNLKIIFFIVFFFILVSPPLLSFSAQTIKDPISSVTYRGRILPALEEREIEALEWLKNNTRPKETVLADPVFGYYVVTLLNLRVPYYYAPSSFSYTILDEYPLNTYKGDEESIIKLKEIDCKYIIYSVKGSYLTSNFKTYAQGSAYLYKEFENEAVTIYSIPSYFFEYIENKFDYYQPRRHPSGGKVMEHSINNNSMTILEKVPTVWAWMEKKMNLKLNASNLFLIKVKESNLGSMGFWQVQLWDEQGNIYTLIKKRISGTFIAPLPEGLKEVSQIRISVYDAQYGNRYITVEFLAFGRQILKEK